MALCRITLLKIPALVNVNPNYNIYKYNLNLGNFDTSGINKTQRPRRLFQIKL